MSHNLQLAIAVILVGASVAYVLRQAWRAFQDPARSSCGGGCSAGGCGAAAKPKPLLSIDASETTRQQKATHA